MKLLPFDQVKTVATVETRVPKATPPAALPKESAPKETKAEEESSGPADGFLINGSTNNGAASAFAQFPAFGNNRSGRHGLYNGGIGIIGDSSIFDARSFSLTGQDTPKPSYTRLTGVATLGGPLKIPHLLKNGPILFLGYQWTRNRDANTATGLMPALAERNGDLTQTPYGSVIPASRISPQALALLKLYPQPNFTGSSGYNYQVPLVDATHQDALQARLNKSIGQRNQLYGRFAFQSTRSSNPNLFNFLDSADVLGLTADANWSHRFGSHVFTNLSYQFSRLSTHNAASFENRENVSGLAGISGNNQSPVNWGPPSLSFSSGITGLSDGSPLRTTIKPGLFLTPRYGFEVPITYPSEAISTASNSTISLNKILVEVLALPERLADPILPIFFSVFPTPVLLLSATQTNTFETPLTISIWRTIGAFRLNLR